VDIATLRGSGPGGEILAEDIMKAAAGGAPSASAAQAPPAAASARPTSPPSVAPSGSPDAVSSIGRIMAERTTQSWTTVPHFFVTREVDATALNATRARWIPIIEKSHGVKVTHTDFIVAAVARALHLHPRMNGSWANDKITLNSHVNVALAMAVENAVVTAVIKDTDRIGLGDIAKQRKELAERARANRLQPPTSPGPHSRSAISGCSTSTPSRRSSCRRRPGFSPSAPSPIAWWRGTA
jgi:pyruvate dehydrogenase E2 component (dihydrolipoamide acetyltransferase)